MSIPLPGPITAYFTADRLDADTLAGCFCETATVRDEGKTHTGRAAIRQWKADAASRFSYTVAPFALSTENGRVIVTGHVAGDFPGSPVDLRYAFTLEGDLITRLEITL